MQGALAPGLLFTGHKITFSAACSRAERRAAGAPKILLLLFNSSKTSAKSHVKPQNKLNHSK
jgi:hypothetical protein